MLPKVFRKSEAARVLGEKFDNWSYFTIKIETAVESLLIEFEPKSSMLNTPQKFTWCVHAS